MPVKIERYSLAHFSLNAGEVETEFRSNREIEFR